MKKLIISYIKKQMNRAEVIRQKRSERAKKWAASQTSSITNQVSTTHAFKLAARNFTSDDVFNNVDRPKITKNQPKDNGVPPEKKPIEKRYCVWCKLHHL